MLPLAPTPAELRARARNDLRMGVPVLLGGRLLVVAVETLRGARLDAMRGFGPIVLALTGWRARTLKARAYDGDLVRLSVPEDRDLRWLQAMADPAYDLAHPMKGPFTEQREGSADLHRAAIALAKEAHLLPAILAVEVEACPNGITQIDGAMPSLPIYSEVTSARLPTRYAGPGRLHVFRPEDGGEEHYAIEIGKVDRSAPVLARLHSACFTGDLLGSLKCDCGPQLHAALEAMGAEGSGVLLYLNQEGRGIGLANKMRAYALQDQGFDTVEANHRLGFEDDERDFRIGSALLDELGIGEVRLMTNNPAKVAMLEAQGVAVTQRVPLRVGENPENAEYLATKAAKSGHLF